MPKVAVCFSVQEDETERESKGKFERQQEWDKGNMVWNIVVIIILIILDCRSKDQQTTWSCVSHRPLRWTFQIYIWPRRLFLKHCWSELNENSKVGLVFDVMWQTDWRSAVLCTDSVFISKVPNNPALTQLITATGCIKVQFITAYNINICWLTLNAVMFAAIS